MQGVCPDKHLRILYFNARSLCRRLDELHALCEMERPEVVCITETWLCDDIWWIIIPILGSSCIRCDRYRQGFGLHCLILTGWNSRWQCVEPRNWNSYLYQYTAQTMLTRVCGLWYQPPANSATLDNLYSVLEGLDASVFFLVLYTKEILVLNL